MTALPEGLPPLSELMLPSGMAMVSVASMDGDQLMQSMWILPGVAYSDLVDQLGGLFGAPAGDMVMGNAQDMMGMLFASGSTDIAAATPAGHVRLAGGQMEYTAGDSDGSGTDPAEG